MDEPLTKDLTVALSLDICSNHSLTVREELLLSWKILSRTTQVFSKRNDEKNIKEVFRKKILWTSSSSLSLKHTTTSKWKKLNFFMTFSLFPHCFSFEIESYIYETDFTLCLSQKYHFYFIIGSKLTFPGCCGCRLPYSAMFIVTSTTIYT